MSLFASSGLGGNREAKSIWLSFEVGLEFGQPLVGLSRVKPVDQKADSRYMQYAEKRAKQA